MNVKALSIIMLLIVVLGFSGVASAATQKVLVQEAYDEQVLVSEAYDEQVLVSEAWNETVKVADEFMQTIPYSNQFFASEGDFPYDDWYNWIAAQITLDDGKSWAYGYLETVYKEVFHPAVTHEEQRLVEDAYSIWHNDIYKWVSDVFEVVHHEAVYETITVIDVEAYDEVIPAVYETITVVDQEAYDETIPAVFEEQVVREVPQGYFNNLNQNDYNHYYDKAVSYAEQQMKVHDYSSYFIKYVKDWGTKGHFVVFFNENVEITPEQIIHHEAVTHEEQRLVSEEQIIHHDAITHEEQILIQEAYDENVLVEAAHYELMGHEDIKTSADWLTGLQDVLSQISNKYPGWSMITHDIENFPAVYETVTVVDVPEYVEYVQIGYLVTGEMFQFHPAVFETIEHPAVFETVHHEAVYKIVHHDAIYKDVEVAEPVTPVVTEPNTVPMQNTGGSFAGLIIAVLLVLGGLVLARKLMK